jgi:hypothetical protein
MQWRGRASHPVLLIKVLPNNTIKSHTIITANAAPHLILSRSIAPSISFVMDARAVEVLATLGLATPDEFFGAAGVSFFTEGCAAAALGKSSAFLGGASIFDTPTTGGCAAANGSSD